MLEGSANRAVSSPKAKLWFKERCEDFGETNRKRRGVKGTTFIRALSIFGTALAAVELADLEKLAVLTLASGVVSVMAV